MTVIPTGLGLTVKGQGFLANNPKYGWSMFTIGTGIRKTKDINGLDTNLGFNFVTHFLGPGLSAENAYTQIETADINAFI